MEERKVRQVERALPRTGEPRRPPSDARRAAGACFGYEVRSDLTFHYLREGGGDPIEVDVDEESLPTPTDPPLHEWLPRPENALHARVWASDAGYTLWIEGVGWYRVDPSAPSIRIPTSSPSPVRREEHIWGLPASLCFVHRGDLPLHAAAVEVGGSAVLLAAPGRFGKTTLAAAFLKAGYRLLAEDLCCCRLSTVPQLLPGPAMLRVRRDVYERLDLPGTYPLFDEPDRVHLAIEPTLRGDSSPVPVAAVIFLKIGGEQPIMRPVSPMDAVRDLWAVSFNLPTDADRARCFQGVTDLASRVPLWELHRRFEVDHLEPTIQAIVDSCSGA